MRRLARSLAVLGPGLEPWCVGAVIVATSPDQSSSRATALVERLRQVSEALIGLVGAIESERWMNMPRPGVWSARKEAEHVADGAAYHLWIVRGGLGQKVPARPRIARGQLTAQRSQRNVVDLLVQRRMTPWR